jgi:aspartate aminotransferase-like enzyme
MGQAKRATNRGYYFDILQYDKYAEKNQTPSTSATTLMYALEAQMEDIGREGIERRWDRHLQMRDATIEWLQGVSMRRGVDLRIMAPDGARSPTVTVVVCPSGMRGPDVCEAVKARGFTIGGGYGDLKETTFRIGHMGDHTLEGLRRCLHVTENAIAELAERRHLVRV